MEEKDCVRELSVSVEERSSSNNSTGYLRVIMKFILRSVSMIAYLSLQSFSQEQDKSYEIHGSKTAFFTPMKCFVFRFASPKKKVKE